MKLERRIHEGITFRDAAEGSGFIGHLEGVAAPYNSPSKRMMGYEVDWIEIIDPNAFVRSLRDNPDVLSLWSHNFSEPIGRVPQTLRLDNRADGLHFVIDLVDTSTNRDLREQVKARIVRGMSFGFRRPRKVEWTRGEGKGDERVDTRRVLDADLIEISPTVIPAYTETSIYSRSLPSHFRSEQLYQNELKEIMEERNSQFTLTEPKGFSESAYWAARLG